ncbi:IQ domain-containing protein H isoform X3 [Centrocercus urophasianus]|uniref:IQ domain-containing protein H isoform X3 n=1 Tax=Centrocercus urophasianus TaxID=9002 RepID=UPI001C652767|nr:IQ domain-containing protein H isoform X3 [Centrocercus urophasianus]
MTAQACSRAALRLSPGSQKQLEMDVKLMLDPENISKKAVLKQQSYETRLPRITKKKPAPTRSQKGAKGQSSSQLWVLPASPRVDSPLPLLEEDMKKDILSLTERRLIPPAAKKSLQTPVVSKAAPLHELHRQRKKSAVGQISSKVEPVSTDTSTFPSSKEATGGSYSSSKGNTASLLPSSSLDSTRKSKPAHAHPAQQLQCELQAAQTQDPSPDCSIAVCHGIIDQTAPGFLAFKQRHCLSWGSIVYFLERTEKLLKDYAVPLATISCQKLVEAASDFALNENPTKSDILSVIKNRSAVEKVLNRPGQRYKGQGGTEMAAIKIQATWRRFQARRAYARFRRQQWASGVIAISWLLHNHMARVKKTLKESRQRHLENFYIRAKHLAANWNRIRTSRRTIIHIPSLGYSQCIRERIPDLALQQNLQLGRLCDILDANVDVIYICPLHLSEELLQYYNKLLGLQAAVRSGNPEDMSDLQDRFKILTPEAINSFPKHHMCLATQLKYSPKTIQRIKILIQSRDAYIIGGVPHKDDLAVADMLNVPILGSVPEVAHLYSTKSGSKRIFASARVPTPPGESDIYSHEQLISALSQLIVDNMEVQRWLFKMNDESGGNGTAFCDIILHLECYHWVLKERQKHSPETWSEKWAHVWATDLDLCYSDQLALTQLTLYVSDGNLDCCSGLSETPLGSRKMKSQCTQLKETKTPSPGRSRYAVASSQLRHSSLSVIYYSVLLQMCKAHGIGFDLQEKQGTVFILYDDQQRCRLGMITIGEDLQGVLMTFARNLFIIHQEISAPNMQGETNFKMAIQDIEAILGVTAENKLKLEEEHPSKADALKE